MITREWVRKLVAAWRTQRVAVPDISDAVVGNSLHDLRDPVGLDVFVLTGQSIPVTATLVLVRKRAPDMQVRLRRLWDQHAPHLSESRRRELRNLWALWMRMRGNWTPGRKPEPPEEMWRFWSERVSGGFAWLLPGDLSDMSPEAAAEQLLLRDRLRPEQPEPARPASPPAEPHIWSIDQDRENVALRRWLQMNVAQLMTYLGFSGLWWYGAGLSRKYVLGPRLDGDIDLLAGPLRLMMSEDEFEDRVRRLSLEWPLSISRHVLVEQAQQRAALEGLVQWPPSLDGVCAIEVKVSWFDPPNRCVKAAHRGASASRRIVGQLQTLLKEGIPRVGFLQLLFTQPRQVAGSNPWFLASQDASDAHELAALLYDPKSLPDCMYLKSSNGALPFDLEDMASAGPLVTEVRPGRRNPLAGGRDGIQPRWIALLKERLGALPRPPWPNARVVERTDGHWDWG